MGVQTYAALNSVPPSFETRVLSYRSILLDTAAAGQISFICECTSKCGTNDQIGMLEIPYQPLMNFQMNHNLPASLNVYESFTKQTIACRGVATDIFSEVGGRRIQKFPNMKIFALSSYSNVMHNVCIIFFEWFDSILEEEEGGVFESFDKREKLLVERKEVDYS